MAEFKLGRIRFVWQGEWANTTPYVVDDVVRNGGQSYICVISHTSSGLFADDLLANPSRWNIVSDGLSWQGNWNTSQYYNIGDQVKYGGNVYICNTPHTSAATTALGLEDDQASWDLLATSFYWTGVWSTSTRYRANDFVVYGGTTYFCNTAHTSASTTALGLEDSQSYWTAFNNGVTYLGEWTSTVRYKINDIVKYGASTWICSTAHSSGASFDDTKWELFIEGLQFEDSWNDATTYQLGDVVTYGGYSYIAQRNNIASNPSTGVSALLDWQVYTTGFNFNGDWISTTTYKVGDVVRLGGYTYLAVADSTDQTPPNLTYWNRLNSGIRWTNVSELYSAVSGTTLTGIGASATFNIERNGTVYLVTVNAPGTNYAVGDTIRIDGTLVGGTVANNITLTVATATAGAINTVSVKGYAVTWTSGVTYVRGDIVLYGANSYICILEHTAISGTNRPDVDVSAIYWNLFAAGSESAVLTVEGDTYYYGSNGPTRLPIGTDGQILRVTGSYPSWAYYGVINNVVYVAPTGVDDREPGRGLTIDKPWKTVRYATIQVDRGYRNSQAVELLTKNKQFFMKEVSNWITSTYSVTITASSSATNQFTASNTGALVANMPIQFSSTLGGVVAGTKYFVRTVIDDTHFTISTTQNGTLKALTDDAGSMTGTLSYDYDFCQRDVGLLISALEYDLSHGGNEEATKAAKAYYTASGSSYINSNFGQQIIQTVAAYNYLKTLVTNVLSNTPPDVNYQSANGVAIQATQLIDNTLTAESGTIDDAVALLTIVTDGIASGVVSAIPAAIYSNTTISVKTGTYAEVLPIIIPKNTAVVGDELRSTVVSPKPAISNLVNDKPKTISALNRIKEIIPSLFGNTAVTVSTGNTEIQNYPYANTEGTAVSSLTSNVNTMSAILAKGSTAIPTYSLPTPTGGTGNAYTAGFFDAARLVYANKSFLQTEITAYMVANQSATWNGLTADQKAACLRDVGYIVDALRYDLTYGGNLATVIAARSYYSNGVFVELAGEKAAALAVQTYLKSIIDNIVIGDSAGWTKLGAGTQIVTAPVGSSTAATFAQARIQEMYDTINTGTTPTTIAPDTSWSASATKFTSIQSVKTQIQASGIEWVNATYPELTYTASTCSRDVGYIVDALAYDMVFGSNFLSSWNAMSYYRALSSTQVVLAEQLRPTLGIIGFTGAAVKETASGLIGTSGKIVAADRVASSADVIYDIINNGLSGVPTEIISDPTNLNINYKNARIQIANNYAFIKADVSQYIQNTYPAIWTAIGATGQASCQRDIGYMLDAIRYDLTYGGNTQSLIAGSAYYSGIDLIINSTEKTATIAAYTHLKSIIDNIAQRTTVTPQAGNTTPQVTSGTGDVVGAAAVFAQDRVQEIIDWITNGTSPASILPDTSWVDASLLAGFTLLQSRKSEIQLDGLGYVQKFHQALDNNQTTSSRDIGYMVDGLGYDMMFGSNAAAITIGRSYLRATSSALVVLASQKDASLGLIKFLKYKLKGYAVGGAVAKAATVIDDIIGTIDGGGTPRFLWPSFTGVDAENFAAAKLIWENTKFIKAEVLAFIETTYPAIDYSKLTCARDVGYIIDAVRYDLTYGGNFATRQAGIAYYSQLTNALQIDSGDKTATLAAYGQMKLALQAIASGGAYTVGQTNVTRLTGLTGDATSSSTVGTLIQAIIDYISDKTANPITETLPSTTWVSSPLVTQAAALASAKSTIQSDIITYISTKYPNLVYDSVTCSRDIGYIIDALGYDLMMGSNYRSIKAGMSYYQAQASKVVGGQKRATLDAFRTLKDTVKAVVASNASALASVDANMTIIINILDKGVGETPDVNGTTNYLNNIAMANAVEVLRANKTFLENEATVWISQTFGGTVTTTTAAGSVITTSAAHNLSVGDPIKFSSNTVSTSATSVTATGNYITVLSTTGMVLGSKISFLGAGIGNIVSGVTYYIKTINSSTQITISQTYNGTVFNPGTATGVLSVTAGGTIGSLSASTQYYVLSVPSTTTFTITATAGSTTAKSVTDDNGAMTVVYSFDEVSCKRDMGEYVVALINDLSLPGNHKGTHAALLYNNAVSGSEASDMYWVSNATGLRNMTLSGLSGDLTEENSYGTRRPTAGAFVALNPGFGPMDSRVWVTSRSHYSQNVTMFGSGCSGAKIDAALHRYGNKSMVKNDFTTIISDGIGVWCTGQDSLTELVSVFNYYGYAGYMAELGGRIRATNGNSSYGTYGVIAEGVDAHEVPLYGTINNQYNQAYVTSVVTDGISEVLRMEYANAGSNYTNTIYTISGSGYNADAIGDEFRDAAVFETRIIDLNDDNGVGGTSYVTQSNGAQTGDLTTITIAATDTALSAAYVGMRIQLTAGSGAGQYANILTYETGSKIAQVFKDSFDPLTVSTTTDTGDYVNVASNATLYVNMPIYFTGTTFGGITANTLYYVKALTGTTQFTISLTEGGAAVNVTTGSGTMTILAAGWDHTIAGYAIKNTLDLTTQYIIEPRVSYTAPGFTATASTLSASVDWKDLTFGDNKYVAIEGSGTTTSYSANGTTWATAGALSASTNWVDVVYGGGQGATATVIIGGLGGQGASFKAVLGVANTTGAATADQVASVTILDGGQGYTTPPVIVFTPVSGGTGAVATCAVLNGAIVAVTVTVPGSGYTVAPTVSAVTNRVTGITVTNWGNSYFSTPTVTIADPFTGSAWSSGGTVTTGTYISYVDTGVKYWYYVSTGGTLGTSGPIHKTGSATNGTATLQYAGTTAIATPVMSNAGVSGYTITNAGSGYTSVPTITVLDTTARYVAISGSTGDNCYATRASIAAGSTWTAGTSTAKTDLTSLTYGNGVYVAVGGTASAVSSTSGNIWTSRTIPTLSTGTYSSVTYGNGTFVAISTGSLETAISSNGNSWATGGNLPSSAAWSSIAYGNGRFVAIAGTSRKAAYSIDKGVTWTASASQLPSSQTWTRVSYGHGLFLAVASGTDVCATSPDGINWTARTMPSSSNWISAIFGNISSNPKWVAISNTTGTIAATIRTGAKSTGRVKVASGVVTEVRMLEPGSGYPKGSVTATTTTTNVITTSDTTNLVDSQPIEFTGLTASGLKENVTYYVIGSTIVANTSFKVSATAGSATAVDLLTVTGLTGMYRAGPTVTLTDPNKVKTASLRVRLGDGALGNPSFTNRGADMATATAEPQGDGYANLYQPSSFINVSGLYDIPQAGANVEFSSLPGVYFKLVTVTNELGDLGNKTAQFQINPALSVLQAPAHGDKITTRLKYSQVRLTGHDFLYIGTGGKEKTNYPNVDISKAVQANQSLYSAGGRVFFTSTDQDGNFNVGNLFGVQQATGTATLNASAFNLSGLNSLQLGAVELGVGSAIITQFSTDPFFTADSDNVVPTQRAIKAYITAQIGGGQSSLNVNTLTSGIVYIAGNSISTTTGEAINVTSKMNFTGGIDGAPVALGFFMQR